MGQGHGRGDLEPRDWLLRHVERYARVREVYTTYARILTSILAAATPNRAPLAIVQSRAKAVDSFAEKAIRKRAKYGPAYDPLATFTDLCGARVIVLRRSHLAPMAEFIESSFDIDWANSVDASRRLQPTEFGYRSIHYIVSLRPRVFPSREVPVEVPTALTPEEGPAPRAEVQLRTVLEHAWADMSHDLSYKGSFPVPDEWQRRLATTAAVLEQVDREFDQLHSELAAYAATYGDSLGAEDLQRELSLLESLLEVGGDPRTAQRLGKLLITQGRWEEAIEVMRRFAGSDHAPLLRDLGVALCKRHRDQPRGSGFQEGLRWLERAAQLDPGDVDALASLGGALKPVDPELALDCYYRAHAIDPDDPYPLGNIVTLEAERQHGVAFARPMASTFRRAARRCRRQVALHTNLPWALFDLARLELLLGNAVAGLEAAAEAIAASAHRWEIDTTLSSFRVLQRWGGHDLTGAAELVDLLELASSAAPGASGGDVPGAIEHPGARVLWLAGAPPSGTGAERGLPPAEELVARATEGLDLRILGPSAGAANRALTAADQAGAVLGACAASVARWREFVSAGTFPREVVVVLDGDDPAARVAAHIAAALGALVLALEPVPDSMPSGRPGKAECDRVLPCPRDAMTLRAFLAAPGEPLEPETEESLARAVHEVWRVARRHELGSGATPWEDLSPQLQDSSRAHASDLAAKLRHLGLAVVPAAESVGPLTLADEQIEALAEMEHGRWNAERLLLGWRLGDRRDPGRKLSPYLVPWRDLPEEAREWDRAMVRAIPRLLESAGLGVRPVPRT